MIAKRDLGRYRQPVPVSLGLAHVSQLASGRIRALVLPVMYEPFAELRPEDLLVVCETVRIEAFPQRPRQFRVRYPGRHLAAFVDVAEGEQKPPAGYFEADVMPWEASRWTLRVLEVERRRLRSLGAAEATECGCEAIEGGWCPPGVAQDMFRPYRAPWSAVGHFVGTRFRSSPTERDPWLIFCRFEAIARNYRRVVGLHSVEGSES